ncbi:MAG: hypothetical protein C4541_13395 [Candidatus Auribacter fodinae]|jgi:hypothetical protein|uniref:Uncharacterized protein n=1 Tax=Candidatus Auribacter fodinae TaxID=2093366 RepID=A0A3A4QQ20_9BACT|nr:MAG: hypothetical protein C4541_13395 [Candidatus Auribacter fodinae]
MFLIIVNLFEDTHLTEVVLAMTHLFEHKLVIQDASTNEEHLSASLSIFADFGSSLSGRQKFCKTISTVTKHEKPIQKFLAALKEADIDFETEKLGNVCVVPVSDYLIAERDND